MKEFWLRLKGTDKPMLVRVNTEMLRTQDLVECERVNRDNTTKTMYFSKAEISSLEEANEGTRAE